MNMKQLFSIALLVSAFAVAPVLAVDEPTPQPTQEQPAPDAPRGSWCPFAKLVDYPIFNEVYGVRHPVDAAKNYVGYLRDLALFAPVKTAITVLIAKTIYDNVDNIKAALGLGQDDGDVEVDVVFADAKCGCTDPEVEEEEAVEVCELDKKDVKKANA